MQTTPINDTSIKVEKLVSGGFGLFRDPAVGLLSWAVPGDQGTVHRIDKLGAIWHTLHNPSAARITPVCQHFGTCGGCQWQMLPDATQQFWKQHLVAEALKRIGRLQPPYPLYPVLATDGLHTRHKVRYQVAQTPTKTLTLQLVGHNPNDRIAPDPCWLITPAMQALTDTLQTLPWPVPARPLRLTVRQGDNDALHVLLEGMPLSADLFSALSPWIQALVQQCPTVKGVHSLTANLAPQPLWGEAYLTMTAGQHAFRVSVDSFFQVNPQGLGHLLATLTTFAGQGQHLLDAYGGVGVFAVHLASQFKQVTSIESHPAAHHDAMHNVRHTPHITCINRAMENALTQLHDMPAIDVAVIDPPRSGLTPRVCDWLGQHVTDRLIMVSCDMPTLARDVARLAGHGFTLTHVQPIDMFPQTHHIEAICLLEKRLQ
jgi:23S rRNA (uracil1939-C5)-methyltransferase